MTTVEQAIEAIYPLLDARSDELDPQIAVLKAAMKEAGTKEAVFETAKLAQPNRQGRKLMQSYFKKKGVVVSFT